MSMATFVCEAIQYPGKVCLYLCGWFTCIFDLIWNVFFKPILGVFGAASYILIKNCTLALKPITKQGGDFLKQLGVYVDTVQTRVSLLDCIKQTVANALKIAGEAWTEFLEGSLGLTAWIVTLFIGWFLWYLTGQGGLLIPVYINEASARVDAVVVAFIAIGNIFLFFQGMVVFFLNIIRPFMNATFSFFARIIIGLTSNISLTVNTGGGGGGRNARELQQADSLYSPNEFFVVLEALWQGIITPFVYTFITVLQIGTLIYGFFNAFWSATAGLILSFGINGLLGGTCLAASPGCFIVTFLRNLFLIFGLDIGGCSPESVRGVPCECAKSQGGPYPIDNSCRPPSYSCRETNGQYFEVKRVFERAGEEAVETDVKGPGPIREVVCARSLPNGQRQQQGRRRILEGEGEVEVEECTESCVYGHGTSFAFVRCGEESFLKGDCDAGGNQRRLEGELWKAHMQKFKKHSKAHVSLQLMPKPLEPQTPNHAAPRITKQQFIKKLTEAESAPAPGSVLLDGCDERGDTAAWEDLAWRTTCVLVKSLALKLPRGLSLPTKQAGHLWRGLQGEHNIHQVLDNLAQTHNEHYPEDNLFADHVEHRRLLEETMEVTKRRSIEAVEVLKEINLRSLVEKPAGAKDYYCSWNDQFVTNLKNCPFPTREQLLQAGTVFDYSIYWVTSLEQQLDPATLLKNVLDCWTTVYENPSIDPGSIVGVTAALSNSFGGQPNPQFKYCFPAYASIDYPGKLTFSWNQFVEDNCKPRPGPTGTVFPCQRSHYDDSLNVINCYDKWTIFAPACTETRLYNSWINIQWLITRAPIYFFSSTWATVMSMVGASPAVVNAFSAEEAQGNRSDTLNWFLFFIHIFSLIWFILFLLLPAYLTWAYLAAPLRIVIKAALPSPIRCSIWCLRICTRTKKEKEDARRRARETKELIVTSLEA